MMIRVMTLLSVVAMFGSCATTTVTFRTPEKGTVGVVDPTDMSVVTESFGDTPVSVAIDKIRGKFLKISQPGKVSQFWFIPPASGGQMDVQVRLQDNPLVASAGAGDGTDPKRRMNVLFRLLLQSSQALARDDVATGRRLAEQAASIETELAAPQILIGLAALQSGAPEEAKAAFAKAKALDPEDKDIDDLLGAIK